MELDSLPKIHNARQTTWFFWVLLISGAAFCIRGWRTLLGVPFNFQSSIFIDIDAGRALLIFQMHQGGRNKWLRFLRPPPSLRDLKIILSVRSLLRHGEKWTLVVYPAFHVFFYSSRERKLTGPLDAVSDECEVMPVNHWFESVLGSYSDFSHISEDANILALRYERCWGEVCSLNGPFYSCLRWLTLTV